jgi:Na+/pantothenate symporter
MLIEKYYYSYMKSQFIITNMERHDKGTFLLNYIMDNIMINFIVIALKLAQTFVVMAKYKLNLL